MSVAELPVVCYYYVFACCDYCLNLEVHHSPTVHQYHVPLEMFTKAYITVTIAHTQGLFQQVLTVSLYKYKSNYSSYMPSKLQEYSRNHIAMHDEKQW